MFRMQSTPDFSVAEHYGLRNTTCFYSKDDAAQYMGVTVWFSTAQYGTVWYSTVQCGTVRYSAVKCGTVRYSAVKCGTVR
jgi:hypothetical protein